MGVKGFNTWFGKTFPQAYVPVKRQVDHLYLDMASFLHEELRKGAAAFLHQAYTCAHTFTTPSAGFVTTRFSVLAHHGAHMRPTACAQRRPNGTLLQGQFHCIHGKKVLSVCHGSLQKQKRCSLRYI